jgi:two-component system, cell cycle sensor histidine kinase and response regulator CckA
MKDQKNRRILIIDDNYSIHEDFRKILAPADEVATQAEKFEASIFGKGSICSRDGDFEIISAYQGEEGLSMVIDACKKDQPFAVAFVDVRMPPGWDGIETIQHLWQADPRLQVVICTAFSDYSSQEIQTRLGETDRLLILKKPFDNIEVRQLASSLAEKWNLAKLAGLHVEQLETLVKARTEELERAFSLQKATLDSTADGILVVDTHGNPVSFNERLLHMWNLPLTQIEKTGTGHFLTAVMQQLKDPNAFLHTIRETCGAVNVEKSGLLEFKDGRFFEHFSTAQKLGDRIVGRVWSFRDITQRRRAEEKLRLLAHTMESIQELATITDLEGRITFANKACLQRYGYKQEELIGQHFRIFHTPNTPQSLVSEVPERSTASGWRGEILNQTKDGREFYVSLRTSHIVDDNGKMIGLVGIAEDITVRKLAEQALRASETQYRLLFESNPTPIYVYDQKYLSFLAVNEAAVNCYGYSKDEFAQITLRDIAMPEEIPAFLDKLSKLAEAPGNSGIWHHRRKDGKRLQMEITSHVLRLEEKDAWLSLAIDVTERLNLEAQLLQSQKMESVGQLAGGIAHDFNNLLTVINGHAGLLLAKETLTPNISEPLREISEAARRAADLTRQLLTFSRKQTLSIQVLDLNEVVNSVSKMLRRIVGEDISIEVNFAPSLPAIKADLGMIEQVLMNLAVNSRDAMPKGGKLGITTTAITISHGHVELNPEATAGQFVCLTFSDTGCGIPPENLPRIFEPFFTTKELDRGTGLGLATVYGIIKQHQGWIKVNSEVNKGTTIQIFLPATNERSSNAPLSSSEQRVIGGTETILVVEDEVPLLKLIRHILESYGYKVLEANNGNRALEVWEQHREKIELLLVDMILPDGMAGQELAELLKKSSRQLKVIYISGYNTENLVKDFKFPEGSTFIQKPFHARKLAETVYDCINPGASNA